MKDINNKQFVIFNNKKHYVNYFEFNSLSLTDLGIKDISEINGLDKLNNLNHLHLSDNKITQINGLDH